MHRFERASRLLTSRLNSLDSLLTIVHLNIEERFLTIQRMDIEMASDLWAGRGLKHSSGHDQPDH